MTASPFYKCRAAMGAQNKKMDCRWGLDSIWPEMRAPESVEEMHKRGQKCFCAADESCVKFFGVLQFIKCSSGSATSRTSEVFKRWQYAVEICKTVWYDPIYEGIAQILEG